MSDNYSKAKIDDNDNFRDINDARNSNADEYISNNIKNIDKNSEFQFYNNSKNKSRMSNIKRKVNVRKDNPVKSTIREPNLDEIFKNSINSISARKYAKKPEKDMYVELDPIIDLPSSSTRFKYKIKTIEDSSKMPSSENLHEIEKSKPSGNKENKNNKIPVSEEIQSNLGSAYEENLCYICFADPPNCIFLECGHGGICLNCSIDTMKKSNFCTLCRTEISQILEIDDKEVRNGIYKVLNSYFITKPIDDDEDKDFAN